MLGLLPLLYYPTTTARAIDDVACSKNPQIVGDIYRGLSHNVTSCKEIFVGHFCAMCKGGIKIIQKNRIEQNIS